MLPTHSFNPYALLPLLTTLVAFILSFLLVFAGSKPGFMSDYAVFTLNTSRIGENLITSFDTKISSLNFSSMIDTDDLTRRSLLGSETYNFARGPMPTAPAQLPARGLGDDIMSDLAAGGSAIGSKATAVASAASAKASEVEGAVTAKLDSALAKAEDAIIEAVNDAYADLISLLELQGWYSIYMSTTCEGMYAYSNGTNVTVGQIEWNGKNATGANASMAAIASETMVTTMCEKHSALDPVGIVRVLYEVGIALTGIALLLNVWGTIRFSRKAAVLNAIGSLPALLLIALASAAVHGVATGAATLINFLGEDIGVAGYVGYKFISLSWATTFLLLANSAVWAGLALVGAKLPTLSTKEGGEKGFGMKMKMNPFGGQVVRESKEEERKRNVW